MSPRPPEAGAAARLVVRCGNAPGVRVTLGDRRRPDEDTVAFSVRLRGEGLSAKVDDVGLWVWDEDRLPDFFDGLAADVRGWSGERRWTGHRLALSAVFAPGGRVGLTWTVRPRLPAGASWEAALTTWLDAGRQTADLAAGLRGFLGRPYGAA
ncbi:DUF6228 family protein [Kitasatospora camelliae]|uniref:DUF6228 family protein n=1 Tax=Kitasatospora camelliae TaxID=3156397 RepID=A0AAU8JQ37_9ACTN